MERLPVYVFAAVFMAAIAWHVAGIDGAFLSDDYGNLNAIFAAADGGRLWGAAFSLFYEPLGNASYAFRPLQYVSYAFDWLVFGASPIGWRASTIALYFVNAVVAGLLVRRWLLGGPANAALGGFISACLLAAYPFAGEVAYYPGGRADALTCLFSLLYLWTFPFDGRTTTGWRHALRVAWLACALSSKESAALLPVVATLLCLATAGVAGAPGIARIRDAVRAAVVETWPSWLAMGGYLAWRGTLYGSIWKVYLYSTPPRDLYEFLDRLADFRFIVIENIGAHHVLWIVAAIAAFVAVVAAWYGKRRIVPKRQAAIMLALFGSALLYFAAPALSFGVAKLNGEGARNFYPAWMCVSLLCAMLLAWSRWDWVPALALVLVMFAGQAQSLAQWHSAAMQMKGVVAAVEGFAAGVGDDQYALLLLPDHQRIALFARNAQGGIVMRPTQHRDYLSRVAVMLSPDFEQWTQHLANGKVAQLKSGRPFDQANFLGLYCWNPSRASIVPLTSGAIARDPRAWRDAAERNFAPAGCMLPF